MATRWLQRALAVCLYSPVRTPQNLHVLQGELARAEAAEIMLVDHCILYDGEPMIEFVQNPLISAYLLTDERTLVREQDANQMLMQHMQWRDRYLFEEFEPARVDERGQRWYTGRQVFSCILPRDFYLNKAGVLIERGVLVRGQLSKKSMNTAGGIIHVMVREYGGPFAADFITGTYNFLSWYETAVRGFTVAIDDCWVPRDVLGTDALIANTKAFFRMHADHDPADAGAAVLEKNLCDMADRVRDVMGRRAQEYFKRLCAQDGHRNGLEDLINSGAKGNATNEIQIAACIGQQRNHKSKRFPSTTCHFTHPDTDPAQAHGMIFGNFMTGMDPIEMFFHLCASHSGLVDTSVKTGFTGYMQRRIAKSLEDMTTDAAGRVLNATGDLVQIRYGGDGFVPEQLESVPLAVLEAPRARFAHPDASAAEIAEAAALTERAMANLLAFVDKTAMMSVATPIHVERAMRRIAQELHADARIEVDAPTLQAWRTAVLNLIRKSCVDNGKLLLYFMDQLSTRNLREWPASRERLERLGERIEAALARAKIVAGEFVGQRGAQSIGTPLTQMTLDSFHDSGAFSTLTTGVPRVGEIVNAAYKLSTPSMRIFIKADEAPTPEQVDIFGRQLIQHAAADFILAHEMNPDRARYQAEMERFEDATLVPDVDLMDTVDDEDAAGPQQQDDAPQHDDDAEDDEDEPEEDAEEEEADEPEDDADEGDEGAEPDEDAAAEQDDDAADDAPDEEELDEPDDAEEDAEEDEDEDEGAGGVFSDRPGNFFLVLHIDMNMPVQLDELTSRCRKYVNLKALQWAFGQDEMGAWIAVAGREDDPALRQWITAMGIHGYDLTLLESVLLEHIGNTPACGVRGMTGYAVTTTPFPVVREGAIAWEDRPMLVTRGTNLRAVLQLPWVDTRYTYTNDIIETERIFGVDVAKQLIQDELMSVMQSCGAEVGARHVALLAERMTMRGRVLPTTYSGICVPGTSVIRNASFENSLETFLQGALRGEADECRGMTECVVVNRELQGGTGIVRLVNVPTRPDARLAEQRRRANARIAPVLRLPGDAWVARIAAPPVKTAPPLRLATLPKPSMAPARTPVATTSASRRRKRALQEKQDRPAKQQRSIAAAPMAAEQLPIAAPRIDVPLAVANPLPRFSAPGRPFVPFDIRTPRRVAMGCVPAFKRPGCPFRPFAI